MFSKTLLHGHYQGSFNPKSDIQKTRQIANEFLFNILKIHFVAIINKFLT